MAGLGWAGLKLKYTTTFVWAVTDFIFFKIFGQMAIKLDEEGLIRLKRLRVS
jgi:hypothetical protein